MIGFRSDDLDRHITGDWGEDSVPDEPEEVEYKGKFLGFIEYVPEGTETRNGVTWRELFYTWEPDAELEPDHLMSERPYLVCSSHREAWRVLAMRAGFEV